jgi:membrane fusion protein, multidrug efflux system
MKTFLNILLAGTMAVLAACGGAGKKEKDNALAEKKADLAGLKKERDDVNSRIRKTEADIAALDSNVAMRQKAKLVSVTAVAGGDFSHFIELQGKVDADNISYIAPRGLPGQVKALYVKKGDYVRPGQLVVKLDDAVQRQGIAAARSQLQTLKTNLVLAKTVYERQKNLWDQNIGSEIQLLQAKNNVDVLQTQMKTVEENVKTAEELLKTANVYSDVAGVVDEVNIRVGELFNGGAGSFGSQIKVINTSSLKVVVNIPENYIGRVGRGSKVSVSIPDIGKQAEGVISFTSQLIDPNQRGFQAEIKIAADGRLKPNQLAQVKILDYAAAGAITVPVNIVQTDEKGKYVFVSETSSNGNVYAKKRPVVTGQFYGDFIEIKAGLQAGEKIVTEGYQNIYDGQMIKTEAGN